MSMVWTIDTFSPVVKIAYVRLLNIYGCYAILAFVLVGHKKCLLTWRPGRGGLYGATTWVCCSGGVWISMQAMQLII